MKQIDLYVADLMPDFRNPRIGSASTKLEAITRVVELQRQKIGNLAESIVQHGLSPIDLLFVIDEPEFPDNKVVVEGNRRATALLLLANPALIDTLTVFEKSAEMRRLQARLRDLSAKFDRKSLEPISAILAPDRDSTHYWVQLRHSPGTDGVGITRWRPVEAARFSDPTARMVLLADLLYREGDLSDLETELLGDISWTTVDRFFESPKLRKLLGIDFVDGKIVFLAPKSRVVHAIREIAFRVARSEFDSRKQNTVDERLQALLDLPAGTLPLPDDESDAPKLGEGEEGGAAADDENDGSDGQKRSKPKDQTQSEAAGGKDHTRTRHPRDTDQLFRKSDLSISDKRCRDVFLELCELRVTKRPNTCGVMLRVFLELSVVHYLSRVGVGTQGAGGKTAELHILIDRAYKYLVNADPSIKLPEIEELVESRTISVRVRELHSYVHSRHTFPAPTDLKSFANELTNFLKAIWSAR